MKTVSSALITLLLSAGALGAQVGDHLWLPRTNGEVYLLHSDGTVVTTYAAAPNAGANEVAVNDGGDAYIAMQQAGVLHVNASGTTNTFYPAGPRPYAIAVAGNGNVWVGDQTSIDVRIMSPTGSILSTVSLGSGFVRHIASGPNDMWVVDSANRLYQFSIAGAVLRTISTGGTFVQSATVDPSGDCWVADSSLGRISLYSRSTGGLVNTLGFAGARDVIFNAANEMYVCGTAGIGYYTPQRQLITSNGSPSGLGVALDGNGDVWVQDAVMQTRVRKHDRYTLAQLTTFTSPAGPTIRLRGDATGYLRAHVFDGAGDPDNDNETNTNELAAGSHPFLAQSTPANPQPIFHGSARPNQTTRLSIRQATDALLGFAIGGSMGNNPQNYIPIPNTPRTIPLENDPFFGFVANNFWIFRTFGGFLDANGTALATINTPNDAQLVGTTWHFAFVTLDQSKPIPVTTISNNIAITVQP